MAFIDTYVLYEFLKRLTTPFQQMEAYRLGLIDDNGNILKRREYFTSEESRALTKFDVLIVNLKKLIGMIPGGQSQLATIAAAIYLMREEKNINESNLEDSLFELESKFKSVMEEVSSVYEDAPTNTTAGIAGLGPSDLKIPPKARRKYIRSNQKTTEILQSIIRRRMPNIVGVSEDISLEYHSDLNDKLWMNSKLKDEVRGKLLQIADAWREFANIPEEKVLDIIITGGNVNYNYTSKSDIDLHLVVDRNNIMPGCNREFMDDYLQNKKILWTVTHPTINIYGYPVELYAQHVEDKPHPGQGVYSISKNKWLQAPENLGLDFAHDQILQDKVDFYKNMIDSLIDQKADNDSIKGLRSKLQTLRSDSIAQGGEFAMGNLIFKELRNQGYLDKINDYQRTNMDKGLSL